MKPLLQPAFGSWPRNKANQVSLEAFKPLDWVLIADDDVAMVCMEELVIYDWSGAPEKPATPTRPGKIRSLLTKHYGNLFLGMLCGATLNDTVSVRWVQVKTLL